MRTLLRALLIIRVLIAFLALSNLMALIIGSTIVKNALDSNTGPTPPRTGYLGRIQLWSSTTASSFFNDTAQILINLSVVVLTFVLQKFRPGRDFTQTANRRWCTCDWSCTCCTNNYSTDCRRRHQSHRRSRSRLDPYSSQRPNPSQQDGACWIMLERMGRFLNQLWQRYFSGHGIVSAFVWGLVILVFLTLSLGQATTPLKNILDQNWSSRSTRPSSSSYSSLPQPTSLPSPPSLPLNNETPYSGAESWAWVPISGPCEQKTFFDDYVFQYMIPANHSNGKDDNGQQYTSSYLKRFDIGVGDGVRTRCKIQLWVSASEYLWCSLLLLQLLLLVMVLRRMNIKNTSRNNSKNTTATVENARGRRTMRQVFHQRLSALPAMAAAAATHNRFARPPRAAEITHEVTRMHSTTLDPRETLSRTHSKNTQDNCLDEQNSHLIRIPSLAAPEACHLGSDRGSILDGMESDLDGDTHVDQFGSTFSRRTNRYQDLESVAEGDIVDHSNSTGIPHNPNLWPLSRSSSRGRAYPIEAGLTRVSIVDSECEPSQAAGVGYYI